MKISKNTLLIYFCIIILLYGCIGRGQYEKYNGITRIAPRGYPSAQRLVWSPSDKNKILVSSAFGPGMSIENVFILDISTKVKRVLMETDSGAIDGMSWSPDGKRVILSATPGTKGYEEGGVWIINLNDNSTESLNMNGYADAAWSPNGTTIALIEPIFTSGIGSQGINIYLIDVKTMKNEIIYTNKGFQWSSGLSWSPDGQQLVFSLGEGGGSIIYMLNIETQKIFQITGSDEISSPVWSPKGNIIAYEKVDSPNKSGNLISTDGKCNLEIPILDFVSSPTWLPDGRQLAFIGPDGIYVIDLEKFLGRDIYQNLCQ